MKPLNPDEYKLKAKELDKSLDALIGDYDYSKFINSLDLARVNDKKYMDAKLYDFFAKFGSKYKEAMILGANYEAWKFGDNGI